MIPEILRHLQIVFGYHGFTTGLIFILLTGVFTNSNRQCYACSGESTLSTKMAICLGYIHH